MIKAVSSWLNCLIQGALTASDIEKGENAEELNERCRMLSRDSGTSSDAEAHEVSGRTSPADTVTEMHMR